MNRYKRFAVVIVVIEILFILITNLTCILRLKNQSDELHKVEIERVAEDLQDTDGVLYRVEYHEASDNSTIVYMNIAFLVLLVITSVLLLYIGRKIIIPFQKMQELSVELAKGNLSIPVKAEKSKYFGSFLWGMDMLRENLEDSKAKELELQREKRTLILSLSHDIKTPLSAISLYAKALSENLYHDEEKKREALQGILKNTKEIEKYINEISKASKEDFLKLEVCTEEFYLSEVLYSIEKYYREKLGVIHTELIVEDWHDCILKGDKNRLIEVLQNVMENAIKYGDGKRIRIFFGEEEDCLLIHLCNTGCDLKDNELSHLFDAFYRGSNSENIKGSGLGLYICKTLMRKMDGDIFAQIKEDNFQITVVVRMA